MTSLSLSRSVSRGPVANRRNSAGKACQAREKVQRRLTPMRTIPHAANEASGVVVQTPKRLSF